VRQILRVTFRWAAVWTLLGLLLGVLLMIAQVEPMAESGAKPLGLSFYAFWIPVCGGAAGVFGFSLGLVFSLLMAFTAKWRTPIETRQGVLRRYGPRLVCGAMAGGLVALPLFHDAMAFLFAALGACSAAVSGVMYWSATHAGREKSLQGA